MTSNDHIDNNNNINHIVQHSSIEVHEKSEISTSGISKPENDIERKRMAATITKRNQRERERQKKLNLSAINLTIENDEQHFSINNEQHLSINNEQHLSISNEQHLSITTPVNDVQNQYDESLSSEINDVFMAFDHIEPTINKLTTIQQLINNQTFLQ